MSRLVKELKRLPGIGQKTAERLAYHLLKLPREEALTLSDAIRDLKEKVHPCSVCANVTEEDPCAICTDPRRDRSKLCVVESPKDLMSLEQLHTYDGLYHVLSGTLAPLEGIGPESLTVEALFQRLSEGEIQEVILATNPNLEGDQTALYLADELKRFDVNVTRLARGLPSGSALEYANQAILEEAMKGRQTID